jgi:2-hydroxychromene-2-carboxylate isomerase
VASSPRDLLERRILPGLVVSLARVSWPARAGAAARRRLGRQGEVELFFSFDDPCSAIAMIDLSERLAGRDARLVLRPVVSRGIPGDPAVKQKRRHAIVDARRLARRSGLALARSEPLSGKDTGFLAGWVAAAPPGPALQRFAIAAMRRLWLEGDGSVDEAEHEASWRAELGSSPPAAQGPGAVARNEALMKKRGPYDVPAAWVHGRWFFAHDRPAQIAEWLDELGWKAP